MTREVLWQDTQVYSGETENARDALCILPQSEERWSDSCEGGSASKNTASFSILPGLEGVFLPLRLTALKQHGRPPI